MAYIKAIGPVCQTCQARAQREVFNRYNASIGVFCSRCAIAAVTRLTAHEEGDALHHIDGDPTNNAPENLRVVNLKDRG